MCRDVGFGHRASLPGVWRKARTNTSRTDDAAKAAAAWRRFVACMELLPPDQAQPIVGVMLMSKPLVQLAEARVGQSFWNFEVNGSLTID